MPRARNTVGFVMPAILLAGLLGGVRRQQGCRFSCLHRRRSRFTHPRDGRRSSSPPDPPTDTYGGGRWPIWVRSATAR